MGLGRTLAVSLVGLTGHVIEVEAHLAASVPGFSLVGLPDAALADAVKKQSEPAAEGAAQ